MMLNEAEESPFGQAGTSRAVSNSAAEIARYRRSYLQFLSVLGLGVVLVMTPLLFWWGLDGAAISCLLYGPICFIVLWGAHQSSGELVAFANLFILATLLVTLGGIYFQTTDALIDPWILTCPAVAFALCKRKVAASWTALTLLALFAVRAAEAHPPSRITTVILALAVVAISIVLYAFSAHIEKNERLIVELGNTDSLTGILNRRSFMETLEAEFRRDHRQSTSMTVFMVDVDHFKSFNDRYGHLLGDEMLVRVADALRQTARRAVDYLFRYGGEEFCVFSSSFDQPQSARFAEQLRASIVAMDLPHEDSPLGKLSVSVGYCHVEQFEALTPTLLIEAADKALYLAKAKGRNCVVRYLSGEVA